MSQSNATGIAQGARVPRPRVEWIDALKGVGIIAVVVGHIWPGDPLHRLIYIWHMPLFFLLAGYGQRRQPDGELMRKQVQMLAIPWLAWSFLLFSIDQLIEGIRGVRPMFPDVMAFARALIWHHEWLRGPFTILWFPPCFFVARALRNVLLATRVGPGDRRWLLVIAGLMALGSWLGDQSWPAPLGLLGLPGALALLIIGGLWRAHGTSTTALVLLGLCAIAALALLPPVNMKASTLGWPFLTVAGGCAIVIVLARLLSLWSPPWMAAIGRMSMTIMFAHVAFVHYLAPYAERWQLAIGAIAGSILVHWILGLWWPLRLLLRGEARRQ